MELKNIKLAALDLDGTLLNDSKELCAGAAETLNAVHKKGIHVVPITGRPLKGLPECIKKLDCIDYAVCSNGSHIVSAKTGETLCSFAISNEKSKKIIALLRSLNCMFEPFSDGAGYCEQDVFDYYLRTFKGTVLADYFFSSRIITRSIEALFENGSRCADEFFVNCAEPSVRDELIKGIEKIGGLQYCNLGDRFIEITRQGVDKGAALETVCSLLGVKPGETIAFGDGENDLLLLEKAGVSVAMGNAFPVVKEKAAIIAKTNNDNGVCEILKLL